ncbi:NUDIX hydrolase [Noviherbaspirillum sp. DKR-6]|uniref:NUDIX hydrolase n=2 Tax=Noviherbaspirillum pedocola TaxID=2801341 RepID=A0A934SWD9_9BURK|nr:NUDIX hydrolase [Noviherbaspirillum pedocola]
MLIHHPCRDDHGRLVPLRRPSSPTPLPTWNQSHAIATATPGCELPLALNGIPLAAWDAAPDSEEKWRRVEGQYEFDEPPFNAPPGLVPAAGVAVQEEDGRIWLVSPSNAYGGYATTLPKGRVEAGASLQASAIREAYEEAGLQVRITGFLADSSRTQSHTRYYLARRVGGNPACMGWESQAVHLVPPALLGQLLTHSNDVPLLRALLRLSAGAATHAETMISQQRSDQQ